jgi:hypothetical protein
MCYKWAAMSDEKTIRSIAREVATATLGSEKIADVISKETVDSTGSNALQITIVLTPGSSDALKGKEFLVTMVKIHDRLQKKGENRFPFVTYADKDELKESGAAQP